MVVHDNDGGWQLDEDAARAYERELVPALLSGWAANLVESVAVRSGERVLDVACGTGIVARHAARRVGRQGEVVGVDINPAMLAVAREVAPDDEPVLVLKEAAASDLPFDDGAFDVVLCQQGLQFFPDPGAALREIVRVTAPGGRVGVSTCRTIEHQPGYLVLVECLARHVGVHAADLVRSPYALGDLDRLRALVSEAGLQHIHARVSISTLRFPSAAAFLHAETAGSPAAALLEQLDDDVRQALVADLRTGLRRHSDDDGVVFPLQTVALTAAR